MNYKPESQPAYPVSTIDGFTEYGMTVRQVYKKHLAGKVLADYLRKDRNPDLTAFANTIGIAADALLAEDAEHAAKEYE